MLTAQWWGWVAPLDKRPESCLQCPRNTAVSSRVGCVLVQFLPLCVACTGGCAEGSLSCSHTPRSRMPFACLHQALQRVVNSPTGCDHDMFQKVSCAEARVGASSFQPSCCLYSLARGAPGLDSIHERYLNEITVLDLKERWSNCCKERKLCSCFLWQHSLLMLATTASLYL